VFREVRPSPSSCSVIDRFWLCDDAPDPASDDRFEVLPDGCIDLVFALGATRGSLLAFGTATQARWFRTQPGTAYLGMRLRPGRLGGLVDAAADGLTDGVHPLDRLGGVRADELLAQLHEAGSLDAQVAALERLVGRAWRARPGLVALDRAVAVVERHAGDIRVARLADEVALGRRQLERQFRQAVGLTPKQFCRVVRFQQVLARLREGGVRGAALAADLGFTDQSHLRRDFIALARRAPAPHRATKSHS
jgi:AraC-like DNA-binding protein